MMESIVNVIRIDGKPVVSSLDIAKSFNKEHRTVLRSISENLKDDEDGFGQSNYVQSSYINKQNKTQPMYHLTKDGFMFLAMGFTGKKANTLKKAYISQFNKMEKFIQEHHLKDTEPHTTWVEARLYGKQARLEFTDVIKDYLIPAAIESGSKNYTKFYMTYSRMLNQLCVEDTGVKPKKRETIRDYLDSCDLIFFKRMERRLVKVIRAEIEKGTHYKEIYQICKRWTATSIELLGTVEPKMPKRIESPKLKLLSSCPEPTQHPHTTSQSSN